MEVGFYHIDFGYWQAISAPSEDVLNSYPSGTIQVPLRPSPDYEWDGYKWTISENAQE